MSITVAEICEITREFHTTIAVKSLEKLLHSAKCRLDEAKGEVEFQQLRVRDLTRNLKAAQKAASRS